MTGFTAKLMVEDSVIVSIGKDAEYAFQNCLTLYCSGKIFKEKLRTRLVEKFTCREN